MTHRTLAATLGLALAATTASAATITLTDCTASPVRLVGKKTVVDVPADDLVIQCALLPLNGQSRIEVTARSIAVDGPNGGSVAAAGKGEAISLAALGTGPGGRSIRIEGSNVTAANRNGDMEMTGPGEILIRSSGLQAGGKLRIACTGGGCPIALDDVRSASNDLDIDAQGIVSVRSSRLSTASPIDRIDIASATADVLITVAAAGTRSASGLVCRDDVLALCPGPDCPLPVTIASPEDAIAFCACDDAPPTEIETGIEGNVRIEAPQGDVDLRGTSVRAGENIDITAADEVLLADASVQNCGPKTGTVTVTGVTCDVAGATLVDDEPDAAPTLACSVSGVALQLGTCSARR
jgi:Hemagglutinin repeat